MSMSRWDPWGDIVTLREAMNTLLEESVVRSRSDEEGRRATSLAIDIEETPESYVVYASVPGVPPEDVEITILGNTLRVRGERRSPTDRNGANWVIRERPNSPFERTMTFPTVVTAETSAAEFNDGVLTITLPKADSAKPRTIPVRTSTNAHESSTEEIDDTARAPQN